jgi:uncharacterized protein (TIRG00374 family)
MSKKWLAVALKITVSGALIWYLLRKIDLEEELQRVVEVDPTMLAAAAIFLLVQIGIGGMRWFFVLKAIGTPLCFLTLARIFYIGGFFSQALPGGAGGDPVRMYMAYKAGISLRGAINGVMLERMATVVALVLLVDITQPFFIPRIDAKNFNLLVFGLTFLNIAAVGGLISVIMLDRLPESLRRWRIVRGLGNLGGDTRLVFLRPANVLTVVIWSILGHANVSLSVYFLALGLGLDVGLLDCLILMPPVLLVVTIPVSIGGWGVREMAMVSAFGLIGVTQGSAIALSILLGLVILAVVMPAGLIWLIGRDRSDPMNLDAVSDVASNAEKS